MACCLADEGGQAGVPGSRTAKRSSAAGVAFEAVFSRVIHFLRTSAARCAGVAPVAVRRVLTLTGSPSARRVRTFEFDVLVFSGEAGAFGLWMMVAVVKVGQGVAAGVGDAVVDGAADFGGEGEHAAKDFAEWGEVVLGHPLGEG